MNSGKFAYKPIAQKAENVISQINEVYFYAVKAEPQVEPPPPPPLPTSLPLFMKPPTPTHLPILVLRGESGATGGSTPRT